VVSASAEYVVSIGVASAQSHSPAHWTAHGVYT